MNGAVISFVVVIIVIVVIIDAAAAFVPAFGIGSNNNAPGKSTA